MMDKEDQEKPDYSCTYCSGYHTCKEQIPFFTIQEENCRFSLRGNSFHPLTLGWKLGKVNEKHFQYLASAYSIQPPASTKVLSNEFSW